MFDCKAHVITLAESVKARQALIFLFAYLNQVAAFQICVIRTEMHIVRKINNAIKMTSRIFFSVRLPGPFSALKPTQHHN